MTPGTAPAGSHEASHPRRFPRRRVWLPLLALVAIAGTGAALVMNAPAGSPPVSARPDSASAASAAVAVPDKVIAYYFHTTLRCPSCRKIEAYSSTAIETGFADEIAEGRLEWRVINIEEKGNEHFVKDYQLYTKSLILSEERSGREVRWKNLAKVWELLGNEGDFVALRTEGDARLPGRTAMSEQLVAVGTAAWLGILTSISPCPLASNIAAVSFVGRSVGSPRRALAAGVTYALGRALTYVVVAVVVVSSILSIPGVSFFLQHRMNQVLGPLLVVIGLGLVGWLRLPVSTRNWTPGIGKKPGKTSVAGAGILGLVFALSFCPVSAGLFFGALIPLAINVDSRVVLPAVYGIGTGLPVVLFALLIAAGAHWVGRAFHVLATIEKAARPVTGVVFILAGLYLTAIHILGLELL